MPIYLQHGNLIDYVPPTDTSTEDVVFMGGLVGIPQTFIPAGELGALSVDGVYMFTKKDGVSVNLGEVVKYCGTTKLAQDSNADLTLGVAVANAEADSLGVKVKINSVLPTDGGGGGGGSGDGIQNLASGYGSLSILGATTTSYQSTSVGYNANASGEYAIAIGPDAEVDSNDNSDAIAIGRSSIAGNAHAVALGGYATANGNSSVAIGTNALTSRGGAGSLAIGSSAQVNGGGASAVGNGVVTEAASSANFGYNTQLYDECVATIGASTFSLRTQLYVIAEGSPLSNQYLNGKAGLAYAVWGDSEIYPNGKVKEGKIIAFETLFSNGVDFVPSTEASGGCLCC